MTIKAHQERALTRLDRWKVVPPLKRIEGKHKENRERLRVVLGIDPIPE